MPGRMIWVCTCAHAHDVSMARGFVYGHLVSAYDAMLRHLHPLLGWIVGRPCRKGQSLVKQGGNPWVRHRTHRRLGGREGTRSPRSDVPVMMLR